MFEPHTKLTLHYADTTIVQPETIRWKPRSVVIHSVRDLVRDPLTLEEFLRRPLLNRGRYLIQGHDQTVNQFRKFYLSNCQDSYRQGLLKLALFNPDGKVIEVVDEYDATRRDRLLAARVAYRLSQYDFGPNRLGVYCDDLKVVA